MKLFSSIRVWSLILIISTVYIINYSPYTYLIGWDSLQVELNPILNIQRNWSSVWQEYQGLGLVAGNAHAVEFIRSIFVLILTFLMPQSIVRYAAQYLFLLIGIVSSYFLFRKLNINKNAAFLGGLYYFFNIGTAQNFYAPFEPFSAFYAFLPLTLFFILNFLRNDRNKLKNLFLILITFIFLTFAFEIPTLFVVFSILFGLISIVLIFRNFKKYFSKIGSIWLIFILVNLFWLFPFIYSLSGSIGTRSESLSNRLSTENVKYQGLAYANIKDISLLKGFWYSNIDYQSDTKTYGYMMQPWISWFDNLLVNVIGYMLFGFVLVGVLYTFLRKKTRFNSYFFIPVLVVSLLFMFGSNGIFGWLYEWIMKLLPPLGEAFRFSFTKWIVPMILSYAFFCSAFFDFVFKNIERRFNKWIIFTCLSVVFLMMVFYTFPYISGNLFYKYNKVSIPEEYKETISYFNKEPANKRIAMFPVNSLWGWSFTDWKYRGSGFIWYGIPQTVMSRTFDVWNLKNEEFYNEFQYAIYSEDPEWLRSVLNKYQIDYVLIDKNVISPGADESLFFDQSEELLSNVGSVSFDKSFGDSILIYKVKQDYPTNEYVYTPEEILATNTTYIFNDDKDLVQKLKNGDELIVQNPNDGQAKLIVPTLDDKNVFAKVSLNQLASLVNVQYFYPKILAANRFIFNQENLKSYQINLGAIDNHKILVGDVVLTPNNPEEVILLNNNSHIRLFDSNIFNTINLSDNANSSEVYDCAGATGGKLPDIYPSSLKIFSNDKPVCVRFSTPIPTDKDMILKVSLDTSSSVGSTVRYCLRNSITNQCENDFKNTTQLQYVFVSAGTNLQFEIILETSKPFNQYSEGYARNIIIKEYSIAQDILMDFPHQTAQKEYEFLLSKNDFPLKVQLVSDEITAQKYLPGGMSYNPFPSNCSEFNQKSYDRIFDEFNKTFEYVSESAVSCDDIDTEFIRPGSSYLVTFDTKNIIGMGLNFCLASDEFNKCLVQDRLKGDGLESFILPAYPAAGDISIHLDNQSIGNYPSRNILSSVTVKKVPYTWLKGLILRDADNFEKPNNILVKQVKKTLTYKYQVTVKKLSNVGTSATTGLIILNQSYENGWGLYDAKSCFLGLTTPFTCKKANAEHVLAKNWANGWSVPSEDAEYLIIFWPQYLQFFGYILLVGSMLGFGIAFYRRKKKN